MNGIENYSSVGENFLEGLTDTLFQGFLPQGGHKFSKGGGGQCPPKGGGGLVKYPATLIISNKTPEAGKVF